MPVCPLEPDIWYVPVQTLRGPCTRRTVPLLQKRCRVMSRELSTGEDLALCASILRHLGSLPPPDFRHRCASCGACLPGAWEVVREPGGVYKAAALSRCHRCSPWRVAVVSTCSAAERLASEFNSIRRVNARCRCSKCSHMSPIRRCELCGHRPELPAATPNVATGSWFS